MFDSLVADTAGARGAGAVGAWARVEAAACARRLAAMLTMLDAACAAQRLTSGAASLLLIAVALRDRLPQVAALFSAGLIDYPLARTIVSRGALIGDPDALRQLDEALAAALRCWEPMSLEKTIHALDAVIAGIDPHAVRRTRTSAQGRSVAVSYDDGDGMATVFATLFATDATAFQARSTGWPTPCAPGTRGPRISAAPTRSAPWATARTGWRACAGAPTARRRRIHPRAGWSSTSWPTRTPSPHPTPAYLTSPRLPRPATHQPQVLIGRVRGRTSSSSLVTFSRSLAAIES
ncbi:MAG: hypothetical protein JWR78_4010 [Mycobacterium sp.]|nr:hypothetical protein [Mycobacterium sp.]